MKSILMFAVLLLQGGSEKVIVRTAMDRTAVWIGDRVTYSIELTCAADVDILVDDLAKDRLQVDGLDILSSSIDKKTPGDNTTHYSARYEMAAYGIDKPSLKIQETVVRYFRKGSPTPEGEIKIPPATIAFRSTLPDGQESYPLRDSRPEPASSETWWYKAAGLLAMMASGAALVIGTLAALRRRTATRPSARKRVASAPMGSNWLEKLKHMDDSSGIARREAFTSLDAIVRSRLEDQFEIPARALTSGEIQCRLTNGIGKAVAAVLKDCEHARYCSDDLVPSSDDWRRTLVAAERVFK